MKNPKWGKTHVKCKGIRGASLCRYVDEFVKDTVIEPIDREIPTCMDCRASMIELAVCDRRIPSAIALPIMSYVSYAHRKEKYHREKM
jgi:hypothetical protein